MTPEAIMNQSERDILGYLYEVKAAQKLILAKLDRQNEALQLLIPEHLQPNANKVREARYIQQRVRPSLTVVGPQPKAYPKRQLD